MFVFQLDDGTFVHDPDDEMIDPFDMSQRYPHSTSQIEVTTSCCARTRAMRSSPTSTRETS